MDMITIINDNFKIFLHLKDNTLYGIKFINGNIIEKIDESVLKFFNFIKLSNNNTKIGNYKEYEVYLDNETNFKHFLHNGKEDYSLFYYNNSVDATCYSKGNQSITSNSRIFTYKKNKINISIDKFFSLVTIIVSLAALTIVNIIPNKPNQGITAKDIHKYIYSSSHLTKEDKEYLDNRDFIEFILPMINQREETKYLYSLKFNDIEIVREKEKSNYAGWYKFSEPNRIYIVDKTDDDKEVTSVEYLDDDALIKKEFNLRKDVVAHEFIHLCQANVDYLIICEACAEILSAEFFSYSDVHTYTDEVRLTKKLMEIIGPFPVLYYNFTREDKLIEFEVKPYLSQEEYDEFKNLLRTDKYSIESETYNELIIKLDNILNKLYFNRYGKESSEDEVIKALDEGRIITRYYFNPKLIDEETSYYSEIDYRDYIYSYEEAFNKGILKIACITKDGERIFFNNFEEYKTFKKRPDDKIMFTINSNVKWNYNEIICKDNEIICKEPHQEIDYLPPIREKDFTPINTTTSKTF